MSKSKCPSILARMKSKMSPSNRDGSSVSEKEKEKGGEEEEEEEPPPYESLGFDLDGKRMMPLPQLSKAALTPPAFHLPVSPSLVHFDEVLKQDIIDSLPYSDDMSRNPISSNPTLALGRYCSRK